MTYETFRRLIQDFHPDHWVEVSTNTFVFTNDLHLRLVFQTDTGAFHEKWAQKLPMDVRRAEVLFTYGINTLKTRVLVSLNGNVAPLPDTTEPEDYDIARLVTPKALLDDLVGRTQQVFKQFGR